MGVDLVSMDDDEEGPTPIPVVWQFGGYLAISLVNLLANLG